MIAANSRGLSRTL